jgi:site-specific recombinase XerD
MRPIERRERHTPASVLQLPERAATLSWDQAVQEFVDDLQREGKERSTLDNLKWVLLGRALEFANEHGIRSVDTWTATVHQRFMVEMKALRDARDRPYSASTLKLHDRNVKQFLRWCTQHGYLRDASALAVKGPKVPDQIPRALTPEEERRLLAVARQSSGRDGGRDGVIVELILRCGLRPREVCLLTTDSIIETVNGDWLLRVYGKGHKERVVPLDTPKHAFSKTLLHYRDRVRPRTIRGAPRNEEETAQQALFLSARRRTVDGVPDYRPLTSGAIAQLFERLSLRSGLHGPSVSAYAYRLRHTFAMRTLAAKGEPHALRRAMGHTSFKMTMKYLEATDEDLIAAWKRRTD